MKTKSFLKFALVTAMISIGIASCENDNQTLQETPTAIEVPEKIISLNKAIDEYNNFYNTRIASFAGKTNSDENRAVWFSLPSLEAYLAKVNSVTQAKEIKVTQLGFILGADSNDKRTIVLAPMTIDTESGTNKAFTIDNGEVVFLHGNTLDNYSTIIGSDNVTESLILSSTGYISSNDAIKLYNNYYDTKVAPMANIVKNDARICFYKQGVFDNYLNFVKQQASNNNINIDGINIVFGVYGNDPSYGEYANHQTLFLAPTSIDTKRGASNVSYTLDGNGRIFLDFNQKTLNNNIVSKINNLELSTIANEFPSTPPKLKN